MSFALSAFREVRVWRLLAVILIGLGLAACKSSEERAAEHYQTGLELLEAGDVDRAIVEFRNVFKLDPDNLEARRTFAQVAYELGDLRAAYNSYLRVVEQLPEDLEGRRTLAELAFERRDWAEFERHATAATEIAPEEPAVRVLQAALDYRDALGAEDSAARREVLRSADALQQELPENVLLRRVRIDGYIQDGEFNAALDEIDRLLEQDPDNRPMLEARLQILGQLGDISAVEEQLKDMVARFPEDDEIRGMLLRFYLSRDDLDAAEETLRTVADPAAEAPDDFITLVQFLVQYRGGETALEELESGIEARQAADRSAVTFQALKAGLLFDDGMRDEAIAQMAAILESAGEDADTQELLRIKVALARMQETVGNEVAARRLVEEVLESDPSNTEALKMRARWMIADDDSEGALNALRSVLDGAPDDEGAMTLMAEAHTRLGNRDLARDFLSRAVEASNRAPEESLRYARLLMDEERYDVAEETLISALRLAPNNEPLLAALGDLYVATGDRGRAEQVVDTLNRLDTDRARRMAENLQAELLRQNQGLEAALSFLDELAAEGNLDARISGVRTRLSSGDVEGAQAALDEALASDPDNLELQFLDAAVKAAAGDIDAAEATYRDLLERAPDAQQVRIQLMRLLTAAGRGDEARQVIDEGLEETPEAADLLWAKASYLERDGDIDGAIAIYEELYEDLSGSALIANNLASLLSTWRNDEESIERAYTVARRLSGTDVPAFQDTYGWILYLRGNAEEALGYLEPAAENLSGDAVVQYHLAKVYDALGRDADALRKFQDAVALAGEIDTRPQIVEAREEISRLRGETNETESGSE